MCVLLEHTSGMLSSVNLLVLKGIFIFIFIINIFLLNCLCVTFSSSSLGFFSTPKLYLGNLCVFVISSGGSAVSLLHPLIVPCDPSPSVFLTCDMIFFFFYNKQSKVYVLKTMGIFFCKNSKCPC